MTKKTRVDKKKRQVDKRARRVGKKKNLTDNSNYLWYLLLGSIIISIGMYIFMLAEAREHELSFDFQDPEIAKQWGIGQGEVKEFTGSDYGLLAEVKSGSGILINRENATSDRGKRLAAQRWKTTPYIKIKLAATNSDRIFTILWVYRQDQYSAHTINVPALSDSIIVDSRSSKPWHRVLPFNQNGAIRQIGIVFPQKIEIGKIEFQSILRPWDLITTTYQQLTDFEPVTVSSINFSYGLTLLGHSLTLILGLILLVFGVLVLLFRNRQTVMGFIIITCSCVVVLELLYMQMLFNYAEASYKISSLHSDRYDEFKSRFGEEFAKLDQELKKHVPEQSTVSFPASSRALVHGESNWLWFLYYGEYENYIGRHNTHDVFAKPHDYVFYYYPNQVSHDQQEKKLVSIKNQKKTWNVEVISQISDNAKLLKVIP